MQRVANVEDVAQLFLGAAAVRAVPAHSVHEVRDLGLNVAEEVDALEAERHGVEADLVLVQPPFLLGVDGGLIGCFRCAGHVDKAAPRAVSPGLG